MPPAKTQSISSSAQAQQEAVSEGIDSFELPKSLVTKIARSGLGDNAKLQKEAVLSIVKSSTVFINYLAATAHDVAVSKQHKSVSASDILKALDYIGMGDMSEGLQRELQIYRDIQKADKSRKGGKGKAKESESASTAQTIAKSKSKGKEKASANAQQSVSAALNSTNANASAQRDRQAERGVERSNGRQQDDGSDAESDGPEPEGEGEDEDEDEEMLDAEEDDADDDVEDGADDAEVLDDRHEMDEDGNASS